MLERSSYLSRPISHETEQELDFKRRAFEIKLKTSGPDLPKKVVARLGDQFSLLKNENDQIDDELDHDGDPQVN